MDGEEQAVVFGLVVILLTLLILTILMCLGKMVISNLFTITKRLVILVIVVYLIFCIGFTHYALYAEIDMNTLHSFLLARNRLYLWLEGISIGAVCGKIYSICSRMVFWFGWRGISLLVGWWG